MMSMPLASAGKSSLVGGSSAPLNASPLLADMLEHVAEACVTRFEKLAGEGMPIACAIEAIAGETAGDVLTTLPTGSITAFFTVPRLGSRLLVTLEDDLVQLVIELMCGGACGEPVPAERRPVTSIDRQFARVIFNALAETLEAEGAAYGIGDVAFGAIETKIDPAALGKRNARISVATLSLESRERSATLRIGFPPAIVEHFKKDAPARADAVPASDPAWTEQFQVEIGRTMVTLDALLDANSLTLGDIANLRLGQVLPLGKGALSRCELRNNNKLLFRCEVGQADARYSLRVDEIAPQAGAAAPSSPLSLPVFSVL